MLRKWYPVLATIVILAMVLSACSTPAAPTPLPPQVVTKVETKIVEKQVTVVVPSTPALVATQPCPTTAPIPVGYHLIKDGELGKLDDKSRIAVISAFDAELALLLKNTQVEKEYLNDGVKFTTGRLMGNDVVLFESGVSMINATKNTDTAPFLFNINHQAMSGISGGVNPSLNIGDVSIPARWAAYQEAYYAPEAKDGTYSLPAWAGAPPFPNFGMFYPQLTTIRTAKHPEGETSFWWPVDQEMLEVARSVAGSVKLEKCAGENCLENQPKVVVGGNGVSGQTFVDNAEYRDWVFRNLDPRNGVNVLDMESAATVITARTKGNGIPTIVFRSLSDLAGGGPGANEIGTFFQLAADNSAKVMMAFLEAWANRSKLQPVKPTKVAFVYVGPVGDMGWSYAHDQGRLAMAKNLPYLETTIVESVPEGPDAERVLRDLAKNNDVVFATSFGYMDSVLAVAKDFPNVVFEHCTGYMTSNNVGIYDGRGYQGWFLAGMTAGEMTKKNVLGYIAPYPIPEVVRNMNAFTLGARSVNPNVKVHIVWINAWFDPTKEREAAQALIDQGADVVARESDSAEADKLCEQAGVYAIGYNSDSTKLAPKAVLTAPVFDWGVYYTKAVQAVRNDTWDNTPFWGTMADGVVKLGPFGSMVPDDVKKLVEAKQKEILAGIFDVFVGPIKDKDGKERVAAGATMSDPDKLSFNWLVEGVVGSIPQ